MVMSYTTDRLILQVLQSKDADKVLSFYERNKNHFDCWEPKRSPDFYTLAYQTTSLILEYNLMLKSKLFRLWIFLKDNPDTIIGCVNFYNICKGPYSSCQIGYKIDHEYTNKGYAYEAINYSLKLIPKEYHLHRVEAKIMPSNFPSIKLIEKLGFFFEGLSRSSVEINGKREDHMLYAYLFENEGSKKSHWFR